MKITLFISSLYGGGAERVTCSLASYLAQQGHEVEILTMSETEESYELDNRVKTQTLLSLDDRKNKIWNTVIRFPRLWRYLIKTRNDAYIVMLPKTTIMLLMFRWMTKAKIIAAERVDPAAYSEKIARNLKKYARKADGFVFQTEDARKWYGSSVDGIKTEVIPNAINPAFIREPYLGEKRKFIAGSGRLNKQKNFVMLVKAFSKIADQFPDYNLVIYGEGEERQSLENLIKSIGLTDRIRLPGNIQNIAEEMEQNSLFVLSSDFEGMPNALMEAMALGLPCISTDCPCGGPRYLIKDGENGILVPVGAETELAEKLKDLLSDDRLSAKLSTNARMIVERLSPPIIYGRWESLIKSVCAEE